MHIGKWIFLLVLLLALAPVAPCDPVQYQWIFNENGIFYDSLYATSPDDALGTNVLGSNYIDNRNEFGLGTVEVLISKVGAGYMLGFFDFEFNDGGSPLDDEFGYVSGSPAADLSWEIGDPFEGNIYWNFQDDTLANGNDADAVNGDDIAVALGWRFNVPADQFAKVIFLISTVAPESGFYLRHQQPWYEGNPPTANGYPEKNLYFSTTLTYIPRDVIIPEPGSWVLFVAGFSLLAGWRLRRRVP